MTFLSNRDEDDIVGQVLDLFKWADQHSEDIGHKITINYTGPNQPGYLKRVDVEGQIIWYN